VARKGHPYRDNLLPERPEGCFAQTVPDTFSALEPLIKALGDNEYVRKAAAEALGKLGDPRAFEPLIKALGDGNSGAASALGTLGHPRAVESLIKALGDRNAEARRAAAFALGKLGDPRAVDPLIRALGNESAARKAAAEALTRLGEVKWEPLIQCNQDDVARLATSGDPRAIEPLIEALGDKDQVVGKAAVAALGALGDPRAVEPLISALGDKNWGLRRAAAEVLGGVFAHPLSPVISLARWQHVHALITAPHHDYRQSSDCCSHDDTGIGLNFPRKPPAGPARKTDF
jgi:HEAT repeat protein